MRELNKMHQSNIISAYEFMAEKIDAGLCAIDAKGQVIIYNKKMRDILG